MNKAMKTLIIITSCSVTVAFIPYAACTWTCPSVFFLFSCYIYLIPAFQCFLFLFAVWKYLNHCCNWFLLPSATTYSRCLFVFVKKVLTGFFFVFMFRVLLPYFMTVGPLGWEDVLPCASLSLPSLFCTHLLGHPKCFSSSLEISLTHNRCGARWGERAWKKNTSLSTAVQCLSPSNSMSMCWCRGEV